MADEIKNSGKTVLIVEDDLNFVKVIETKLHNNGMNTLNARTVADGLSLLQNNKIDLIWLDHYLLGDENGYDFVSTVKKDKSLKNIPIFLVTNYDDYGNTVMFLERLANDSEAKTYLEYGIEKYFVKSNTSLDTIITEIKKKLRIG